MNDLPGYTMEALLGSGSSGAVYRARQHASGNRMVAVKRVSDPALARQLMEEGQVLAHLDHPSIVRVHELVADGRGVAIVMQYAAGGSLEQLLSERGRLSDVETVAVAARLADALASAHRRGVLHRDVKPANILFTAEGHPMLADFGLATETSAAQTQGSAAYLDPALPEGGAADVRGDVYALGVCCYEMLTGMLPFPGDRVDDVLAAAEAGRFTPLTQQLPDLEPALAETFQKAMARQPEDRFPDAASFATALQQAAAGPSALSTSAVEIPQRSADDGIRVTRTFGPRPPQTDESQEGSRVPWPAVVLVALLLLAAPIALVLTLSDRDAADDAVAPRQVLVDEDRSLEGREQPRCETPGPDTTNSEDVQLARMQEGGCPVPVRRDGGMLVVETTDGEPIRFEIGTPTDAILIADFTCSGIDTPAVYRPSTGEVFVFEQWADEGRPIIEVNGYDSGVVSGVPQVLTDQQGCAELRIREPTRPA